MSRMRVKPVAKLKGEVEVPGDKSISHRAVMLGAIARGKTKVKGFLQAEDCRNTISVFRALGVEIEEVERGTFSIVGRGLRGLKAPDGILDVGNSGTTMRLLLGILVGQKFDAIITGDRYLRRRPMRRVVEPLRKMGAQIDGRRGGRLAPLCICGGRKLMPIRHESPLASAQVKSAVLLAGLFAGGETSVEEPFRSRDHTERMLKLLGADIKVEGLKAKVMGNPTLKGREMVVPGDISSASFLMVGAAILEGSEVLIKNVGVNPTRTGVIDFLRRMGANVEISNVREESGEPVGDISVSSSELKPIAIEAADVPRMIDEVPILALAAAFADGESVISGASELRVKETDRIKAMVANLRSLGVNVEERKDGMVIRGGRGIVGGRCTSFGDHRMAMAMVIAGLASRKGATIAGTECIEVSFPGFMEVVETLSEGERE